MLIGVLVLGAVGVAIVVSLMLFGLGNTQSSLTQQQAAQAKAVTDACVEHALSQFRLDPNYAGEEELTLGGGSCSIGELLGEGNQNRTVQVEGKVADVTRRVEVVIERRSPELALASWQEVADLSQAQPSPVQPRNTNCQALNDSGESTSGVYQIDPDDEGPINPFDAFCEMAGDVGWTLVMRLTNKNFPGSNWATTRAYQQDQFANNAKSFKYSDTIINTVKGNRYRIDAFDGSRFFDGACLYAHNTYNKSSACGISYTDITLTTVKRNSTNSSGCGYPNPDTRVQGIGDLRCWWDGLNNHIQTHVTYCESYSGASNGFPNCNSHWTVQCGSDRSASNNCKVDTSKNNFTMWVGGSSEGAGGGGDSGADRTAPAIESLSPTDDATNVLINSKPEITFTESVQKGAGNITIKYTINDNVVHVSDVTGPNVIVNNNKVTIDPGSEFSPSTGYYILIAEGTFKDLADNDFTGVNDKTRWNFTTAAPSGDATGYSKYRLYITGKAGNKGGVRAGIWELRLMRKGSWQDNKLTGNASGTVGGLSATASASANTTPAWYGFDAQGPANGGDSDNGQDFYVDGSGAVWLRIDFPFKINVNGYRFYGGSQNWPTAWRLQGSNDGSSWQTLHSGNGNIKNQWYENTWPVPSP